MKRCNTEGGWIGLFENKIPVSSGGRGGCRGSGLSQGLHNWVSMGNKSRLQAHPGQQGSRGGADRSVAGRRAATPETCPADLAEEEEVQTCLTLPCDSVCRG